MDPRRAHIPTIWLAAAILFAVGFLVSIFTGSIFVAIICLLAAGGCFYASRRPPLTDDGDAGDPEPEPEPEREREDDEPRKDDKRLWSEERDDPEAEERGADRDADA